MKENELHVVRSHKDTVFRTLFKARGNSRELYNAFNKTDFQDSGQREKMLNFNASRNREL